jgi:hypothetical protein
MPVTDKGQKAAIEHTTDGQISWPVTGIFTKYKWRSADLARH